MFSTSRKAQLDEIEQRGGRGASGLSESKLVSGLHEAWRVGTTKAVQITGQQDGYFGDEAITILMPTDLRPLERGPRAVGFGPKIDDFILSMNCSAEAAAPAARKIFVDAILAMTSTTPKRLVQAETQQPPNTSKIKQKPAD